MSPSMATTFEPELQSIMTDKDTEEMISRDSKFRERYSTQIPKSSSEGQTDMHNNPSSKNLRFWKSCLSAADADNKQPKSVLKSHQESVVGIAADPAKNTLKKNKKVVEEKFAGTVQGLPAMRKYGS